MLRGRNILFQVAIRTRNSLVHSTIRYSIYDGRDSTARVHTARQSAFALSRQPFYVSSSTYVDTCNARERERERFSLIDFAKRSKYWNIGIPQRATSAISEPQRESINDRAVEQGWSKIVLY